MLENSPHITRQPTAIIRVLQRIEDTILVGLLLVMIFFAATQIFLRNFFDSGIVWADSLVRVLVLWVGLLGAMVASRKGDHIRIDLITRYLPQKGRMVAGIVTDLFTAFICAVVFYHGFRFVKFEYMDGVIAFAKVPAWLLESIIPAAFCVITLRYTIRFIHGIVFLLRSRP